MMNATGTLTQRAMRGFVVRGVGLFGGLAASVVLARVLGPTEYGLYAFAVAVMGMLAMPVLVGLPTLLVRETATSVAQGQLDRLSILSGWAYRVICLGSLALILTVLGAAMLWPGALEEPRLWVLVLALPMVPILALGQARSAILRGLGQITGGLLPEAMVRPLMLILALTVVTVVGSGPVTAPQALACLIFAGVVSFGVGAYLLYRAMPRVPTKPVAKIDPTWLRAIVPLSLIGGLQTLNTNVDLVLLGVLRDAAEAGQYRIAVSGATVGLFALTTLRIVLQPQIAHLAATGDLRQLQRVISSAAALATGVSILVLLVILAAGDAIVGVIFGAAYGPAVLPLTVLLAGNVVLSVFAMSTPVLTMTGAERRVLPGLASAAVLNVALNLWLIPLHGVLGAALATAVALGIGQWVTYRIARTNAGINAAPWPLIHSMRPVLRPREPQT